MNARNRDLGPFLTLAGALLCVAGGIFFVYEIAAHLKNPSALDSKSKPQTLSHQSLTLVDSALNIKQQSHQAAFTGDFKDPFRILVKVASENNSGGGKTIPTRIRFSLRGVLIKDRPLAIIEDEKGETYIRGVGDKVGEQSIVKIEEKIVVLKDRGGSYELSVEQK